MRARAHRPRGQPGHRAHGPRSCQARTNKRPVTLEAALEGMPHTARLVPPPTPPLRAWLRACAWRRLAAPLPCGVGGAGGGGGPADLAGRPSLPTLQAGPKRASGAQLAAATGASVLGHVPVHHTDRPGWRGGGVYALAEKPSGRRPEYGAPGGLPATPPPASTRPRADEHGRFNLAKGHGPRTHLPPGGPEACPSRPQGPRYTAPERRGSRKSRGRFRHTPGDPPLRRTRAQKLVDSRQHRQAHPEGS